MKINADLMHKPILLDSVSFKIIFLISYVVFFIAALFLIFLPASRKSWLFSEADGASFFKSVESGVYSFMSYLN